MVKWKEKAVHQFYTGVLTQTNNRYRAAGKNQAFMFFVAVIHSEQHTIYVANTDKKVQLVSPFLGHIGII